MERFNAMWLMYFAAHCKRRYGTRVSNPWAKMKSENNFTDPRLHRHEIKCAEAKKKKKKKEKDACELRRLWKRWRVTSKEQRRKFEDRVYASKHRVFQFILSCARYAKASSRAVGGKEKCENRVYEYWCVIETISINGCAGCLALQ